MRGLPLPRPCHLPQGPRLPRILPESPTRPRSSHSVVPSAPCMVVSNGEVLHLARVRALCDLGGGAEL